MQAMQAATHGRFSVRLRRFLSIILCCVLFASACASQEATGPADEPSQDDANPTETVERDDDATAAPSSTDAQQETPTPTPGVISDLQEVERAIIQIEAQGNFSAPQVGSAPLSPGDGSGFIIDEAGIAVTNHHTVSGADQIRVHVGSDETVYDARLLGASECLDLAVIAIEGENFSFLEWTDDKLRTGVDVFAAGFPVGDTQFELNEGSILQVQREEVTGQFAADGLLTHDATVTARSAGGPLLNEAGEVVGVTYVPAGSTSRYTAIGYDEAQPIVERLRSGAFVHSIGVNGVAVQQDDTSGIWVMAVRSGSPAQQAGVQPGDLITRLGRRALAADDAMGDYCEILRTHQQGEPIHIEVLRSASRERFTGQLNGRKLAEAFSFVEERTTTAGTPLPTASSYNSYQTIADASRTFQVDVPVEWRERVGNPWAENNDILGYSIVAAPDIEGFYSSWQTPGVFFGVSPDLAQTSDIESQLNRDDFSANCTPGQRGDYEYGRFSGRYVVWTDCGDTPAELYIVAMMPDDTAFLALAQVQVTSTADLEALDRIISSFEVTGSLP